jgi:hypothetical protein
MKQAIRNFLYLIIALLVLEVIKRVLVKTGVHHSYFINILLLSLQMLLVWGFVIVPVLFAFCRKHIKHSSKAMGMAVLIFLVFTGALEGIGVWFLHRPAKLPYTMRKAFEYYNKVYGQSVIQFDPKASVYDPELFYTLKPDARFRFVNAEFDNAFSTNRMGVRDNDSSLNNPAVISIGDSYAMGWGVEEDSTYSERLQALSGKKVLNTAISSYGTAREVMSLRRFDTAALTYLVAQYYDNDYGENIAYLNKGHMLKVSSRQVYENSVKSERLKSCYYPGKVFLNVSQILIKQLINKVIPVFRLVPMDLGPGVSENLQAKLFLDILSDAPVSFSRCKVIVLYPSPFSDRSKMFEMAVEALLQEPSYKKRFGNNLRVLKVSEQLQSDDFYLLDIHLRNSGHRKIAQGIWNMMQSF